MAAWSSDSETDLLSYWTRYTASYGAGLDDIRAADAQFAKTSAFSALARLNAALEASLNGWVVDIVTEMTPKFRALVLANIKRVAP